MLDYHRDRPDQILPLLKRLDLLQHAHEGRGDNGLMETNMMNMSSNIERGEGRGEGEGGGEESKEGGESESVSILNVGNAVREVKERHIYMVRADIHYEDLKNFHYDDGSVTLLYLERRPPSPTVAVTTSRSRVHGSGSSGVTKVLPR